MSRRRVLCWVPLLAVLALCSACSRKPSPQELRGWDADLQRLQAEQDSLRSRAADLVEKDPRVQALPKGDVVVAVPTVFLRGVIKHVFDDVASHITLRLGGIKVHAAKSIKKVIKVGEFVVDVDITQVVGKLEPGDPSVTFGGDSVSMSLPIKIAAGHGEAIVHFVWNGKNIADLACGDLDITQKVSGNVIPASYLLSGALTLKIRGHDVVGALVFPETRLRIRIKPSKESWDAIQAILDEKHGVCGWVLDKVDVPKLLTNLVEEKGFNVRLPVDKIKPFLLPAGVRDSVNVGGSVLFVDAKTNLIRIDPAAIWYSAGVSLQRVGNQEAAHTPDAAPERIDVKEPGS